VEAPAAEQLVGRKAHPLEVAALLEELGAPEHVVLAGLLHDSVEDGDATLAELRERFGPEVADLVEVLTEDDSIEDWRARKAALRDQVAWAPDDAVLVFAADKLSKVLEGGLDPDRLEHHGKSLRLLEVRLGPEHPLVARLREALSRSGATSP
jgi:hypothetical protein